MKRREQFFFCLFVFTLLISSAYALNQAVAVEESQTTDAEDSKLEVADDFPGFCAIDDAHVERLLHQMSLRDKVAQMFMVGPAGMSFYIPKASKRLISELGLGGVFLQPLKTIQYKDPVKTAKVVIGFQELALARKPSIPLLFSLDQEGGIPQSFQSVMGATDGPGNLALAATGKLRDTYNSYSMMGREVRAIGASVSLAPTLDRMVSHLCRPMYTRTFGQNVEQVDQMAAAAVKGFQDQGVVACIKHFPGGGGAFDDPHYGPAVTNETEQEIRELHLKPFLTALSAGADMVMTGVIRFSCWDEKFNATLSKKIKIDLLRNELGYDGVIITDDLGMGAVTGRNEISSAGEKPLIDWGEDLFVLSIQTGSDMILLVDGVSYGKIAGLVDRVVQAVKDGRLTEERIEQSVRRILRLKQKYCLFEKPLPDLDNVRKVVGSAEHKQVSKEIIARAITVVRNEENLWPLDPNADQKILVVSPHEVMFRDPGNTFPNATGTTIGREIKKIAKDVKAIHFMPGNLQYLMNRAVSKAKHSKADLIVLVLHNAHYDPPQIEMAKKILALGKPTIVVSEATPYELMDLPEAKTYICTYSSRTLTLEATAEVLFGLHNPQGKLPVALEGLYPLGHSALQQEK